MFAKRDPAQKGYITRRRNRASGAPVPASHLDWLDALMRWPTAREREKVLGTTLALWCIDPETGESDKDVATLALECGSTEQSMQVALDNLAAGGWIEVRQAEGGSAVHRLTLPIFDQDHPDFTPMSRLVALSVGTLLEELEERDGLPEEVVLFGALAAVGAAIKYHHGGAELERRLRYVAETMAGPDDPPATGPSGG